MKLLPCRLRSFNGGVGPILISRKQGRVQYLVNRSYAVDMASMAEKLFDSLYEPFEIPAKRLQNVLAGLRLAALNKGMTVLAADVLPKLVAMTKEQIKMSTENGSAAEAAVLADAEKEHKKDGAPSGKAPRKLAGAALKAYNAKLEREAAAKAETKEAKKPAAKKKVAPKVSAKQAEADQVVAEETAKLQHAEANDPDGDHTLTKTGAAKLKKTPNAKAKVEKAAKELKAKQPPKVREPKTKKPKTDGFDPASLKNKDGKWKSASAMMKGLIWEGKIKDDQKLFAQVQKEFDLSDDKFSYIAWNRGWFKRSGIELPA